MASVQRKVLPSGSIRWIVSTHHGPQRLTDSYGTQREAEDFKREVELYGILEARARRDASADPENQTLREWTEEYLDPESGWRNVSDRELESNRRMAEATFLEYMGHKYLSQIDKREVNRWIRWQEEQPLRMGGFKNAVRPGTRPSKKTMTHRQALLSTVLQAAVEEGLIEKNPARGAKLSETARREPVYLDRAELGTILAVMRPSYRPLATWLAFTGMRFSEATALQWKDIDERGSGTTPPFVHVRRAWKDGGKGKPPYLGVPKTQSGQRKIPLGTTSLRVLPPRTQPEDFVFQGIQGVGRQGYTRFYENGWRHALERARDASVCEPLGLQPLRPGREPRIHDLRHTYAKLSLAVGVSIVALSRQMGHASVSITIDRYAHLADEAFAPSASKFDVVAADVLAHGHLAPAPRKPVVYEIDI